VPRTATVKARHASSALRIAKDLFFRLINEFPQMASRSCASWRSRLEASNQKLREALARTAH
jgi:CRP-like cAMP-binding protein